MSGPPPNLGPTRVILHVKGDVPEWKEEFKQFLLTVKDSEGYFRYRWGPWEEDHSKLEILASMFLSSGLYRNFFPLPDRN